SPTLAISGKRGWPNSSDAPRAKKRAAPLPVRLSLNQRGTLNLLSASAAAHDIANEAHADHRHDPSRGVRDSASEGRGIGDHEAQGRRAPATASPAAAFKGRTVEAEHEGIAARIDQRPLEGELQRSEISGIVAIESDLRAVGID